MKTIEVRKAILEVEITKQLKKGWRISSRSETGCQLIIDKNRGDCLKAISYFFFPMIPEILYLPLPQKTISLFIEVDEEGIIIYSKEDLSSNQLKETNYQANKDLIQK